MCILTSEGQENQIPLNCSGGNKGGLTMLSGLNVGTATLGRSKGELTQFGRLSSGSRNGSHTNWSTNLVVSEWNKFNMIHLKMMHIRHSIPNRG